MMKILVTGCCGYLGSQLVRDLLKYNFKVKGIDNFIRNNGNSLLELISNSNSNFEFIRGDICYREIMEKCLKDVDFIVNLVGIVGEPACNRNEDLAKLYNADMINQLIDLNKNKIPILQSSTGSVYGSVPAGTCNEATVPNPISWYAQTKLIGEKYLTNYAPNYLIYRLATVYGVSPNIRLDLLINDLTYKAVKDRSLVIFQKEFRRTFLHVKDISLAFIHGIINFNKMKNQTYNVGDEKGNWTKEEIAELLKQRTKCSVFYGENGYKDNDQRNYSYVCDKIKQTGWKPTITIEEGIEELIKAIPLLNIKTEYDAKI